MKKKLMILLCALTLMFGSAFNVSAAISPSGNKDHTETTDKTEKAPKTGESDLLIYGIAAAMLCTGTAVVSKKRLEALK